MSNLFLARSLLGHAHVVLDSGVLLLAEDVENSVEAHVRPVKRRLVTSVDEEIVEETTEGGSNEGGNDGHPEVVVAGSPDLGAISNHGSDKSGAKISGQVDSIAGFPSKTSANGEDEEKENERSQGTSREVLVVVDGENSKLQNCRGNHLREELAGGAHEFGRVGTEDACGGLGAANGSAALAALVDVDGRSVVSVNERSTHHTSQKLGNEVDGELTPGEASVNTRGESHGGVEMTTGNSTSGVHAKHDTETPAPRNGLVVTLGSTGKSDLGDDTVTEENENQTAPELSKGLSQLVSDSGPEGGFGGLDDSVGHD